MEPVNAENGQRGLFKTMLVEAYSCCRHGLRNRNRCLVHGEQPEPYLIAALRKDSQTVLAIGYRKGAKMLFTTIVSTTSPQMVWDVPNGTLNHVPIEQNRNYEAGLGARNQQWLLVGGDDPAATIFIVSRCSGQLLGVSDSEWQNKPNPFPLYQDFRGVDGLASQVWSTSNRAPASGGRVIIYSSFLDSFPPEYVVGIPADQIHTNGAQLQLVPLYPLNRGTKFWNLVQQDIKVYAYFSRLKNRHVLDVPGFSQTDNERVQQYGYNGGTNQLWVVTPPSGQSQYHHITALHSDKFLQLSNDGYLVQATYDANSMNQQWEMIPSGINDSFLIQNRRNGLVLDLGLDETYVLQNQPNGSASQEWWAMEAVALYRPIEV